MENEIKKIFLTYKVLSEIKKGHKKDFLTEAAWVEVKSGLVSDLEDKFEVLVKDFKSQMSRSNCVSTFISGFDTQRKNPTSLHRVGKAVDIRTFDHAAKPTPPFLSQECINKGLKICKNLQTKYPGLYCSHEKSKSQSSVDFTAPHFHMEWNGGGTKVSDKSNGVEDVETTPSVDPLIQSVFGSAIDKITSPIRSSIQKIAPEFLSEQFDFGVDSTITQGRVIINPSKNKIKSPITGKIISNKLISGCSNQILIKSENNKFYLLYCGMTDPKKTKGVVSSGEILGTTNQDVQVTLYNSSFRQVVMNSGSAYKITSNDDVGGTDETPKTRKKSNTSNDNEDEKRRYYSEPLVGAVGEFLLSPLKAKFWKKLTQNEEENLKEDLQRIKKLLK